MIPMHARNPLAEIARLRDLLTKVETVLAAHNASRKHEGRGCPWDFGEEFGGILDQVREALASQK